MAEVVSTGVSHMCDNSTVSVKIGSPDSTGLLETKALKNSALVVRIIAIIK